jgi:nuclear transport factor 2 (NTF2) superfamily protein
MDVEAFNHWLQRYGDAWQNRDPEAAVLLFSADGSYQETPYDIPMQGSKEIREYWEEVPRFQEDVSFQWEVYSVSGNRGIAHWQAEFTRRSTGVRVHLDGILAADFDADGLCCVFREWWHRQEK